MKVRELMSKPVVRIHADEPVTVAARTLTHYNIGAMPVCGRDGKVCGMVTDRDLVTRCMAAHRSAEQTAVGEVMTRQVLSVEPSTEVADAARLMAKAQVRRLPVVENGRLCGMLSFCDLAKNKDNTKELDTTLLQISGNISAR